MRFMYLLAAACLLAATTAGAGPVSVSPDAKLQPALIDAFQGKPDTARVRAIVSLEAEQPSGLARAAAIAAAQDRVLGAFSAENNGAGLAVLARYRTLFGFSAELTRGQAIALARRGDVAYVEEMPVHKKLWPESHPLTHVNLAQNDATGVGAVIAIIDDGIDADHPAFTGKLLGGYDFADFDDDPTIGCSSQSHGTSVAGVALGNGGGAHGVAPDAKMVFLKIQSSNRRYCGGSALNGDLVGAIDWVTFNKDLYGIDIISMSLGGGLYSSVASCDGSSTLYRAAIDNATAAGITIIAASGNDGMCDAMSRPACFSNVISVGAVYDLSDGQYGWCVNNASCANPSYNPGCPTGYGAVFETTAPDKVIVYSNSASFLDVLAPATCATSAVPNNGLTTCFGGTSSATPFTSGAAALAVETAGKGVLTPADMRSILVDSGDLVTDSKNQRTSPRINGLGVINEAALFGGGEPPPPPTNAPPTASFSETCVYLDCDFTDTSGDSDGSVTSWSWTFGDGATSAAQSPSHSYGADGSYTVTLTVTDNDGDSDTATGSVTVSAAPSGAELTSTSDNNGKTWTASVQWSDGSPLSGSWSTGDTCSNQASCSLGGIAKKTGSVDFTADDGSTITVNKP